MNTWIARPKVSRDLPPISCLHYKKRDVSPSFFLMLSKKPTVDMAIIKIPGTANASIENSLNDSMPINPPQKNEIMAVV